jgi:cytochrome c
MARHHLHRAPAAIALAAAALLGAAAVASPARAEGDAAAGEAVFKRSCAFCHSLDPAAKKQGPHLDGLIGRSAGSVAGFNYSPALAQSGIVWSAETLDAFLAAPIRRMPGTKMSVGVPSEKNRADLIAYLLSIGH